MPGPQGPQKRTSSSIDEHKKKNKMQRIVREVSRVHDLKVDDAAEKPGWRMIESTSNPGHHYYYNDTTGESVADPPADFDRAKPLWERKESRSNPGEHYYYNSETGESRAEKLGPEPRRPMTPEPEPRRGPHAHSHARSFTPGRRRPFAGRPSTPEPRRLPRCHICNSPCAYCAMAYERET